MRRVKKSRQDKAKKVLRVMARRMMARLLGVRSVDLGMEPFQDLEFCHDVRDLYGRHMARCDRLLRSFDLAGIVA